MNRVDLTNCDREPIHILGAIQPFGFLLAVSPDWMVRHASANAAEMLGASVEPGAPAAPLLGEAAVYALRRHVQRLRDEDAVERIFDVPTGATGAPMDFSLHRSGGSLVIEAEPTQSEAEFDAASVVRATIGRLQRHRSVVELCREAVRQIRALTGFDRVMAYRFDEDGAGEVVAEAARSDLESFQGLRYPASDIPQQARALYLRNWLRIIADINADPVPVRPQTDADGAPLDLSHAKLRAVSPIHIEYLRNMAVSASLSVSIIVRGKLWGLFACHHYAPRRISYARRTAAELYGQMFSLLLESQQRETAAHYELGARDLHNRLMAAIADDHPPFDVLSAYLDDFCEVVACDGVGVYVEGKTALRGATPSQEQFVGLLKFLNQTSPSQLYATHELGAKYEPAKGFQVAGLLAVPISRAPRDYLVFFRKEVARTVNWAGDPNKPVQVGPLGDRLTPRKSFELWRETVRGQSAHWSDIDRRIAESLRVTMLEVVVRLTDVAVRERKIAQERQELLIAELNHRVRNILTLIRGLVAHSKGGAGSVDEFASVLNDRINALSRAHDQITKEHWEAAPLADLFAAETAAYLGRNAKRVEWNGPPVLVAPHAFATLALVVHELVTNSAKYGALKDSHGRVKVSWALDSTGRLTIDWIERGGPPVQAPTRRGFGSTVIERSVPYDLQGDAQITYALAGIEARFVIPAAFVRGAPAPAQADSKNEALAKKASKVAEKTLKGRALLVEDNLIIALDAQEMLLRMGASAVDTASSVADALALIEKRAPDFALLDVNLTGETSFPAAERLKAAGVPFVFATGYGDDLRFPDEFADIAVVTKPYNEDDILNALQAPKRAKAGA